MLTGLQLPAAEGSLSDDASKGHPRGVLELPSLPAKLRVASKSNRFISMSI